MSALYEDETRSALARRFFIAVAAPLAVLVLFAALMTTQVFRMQDATRWADHTAVVTGKLSQLHGQIVDQETSLRGFLLSNDRAFLAPYEQARPLEIMDALRPMIEDNPVQVVHLEEVRRLYTAWLVLAAPIVGGGVVLADERSPRRVLERKERMDEVRAAVAEMLGREHRVRRERIAAAAQANRTTLFGGGILFAILAVAIVFISRRQLAGVEQTYSMLRESERATAERLAAEAWVRERQMALSDAVRGDRTLAEIGASSLSELAKSAEAVVGAFYVSSPEGWERRAGYALDPSAPAVFRAGEGLVGQAARDGKLMHVTDAPSDFLRIRSGTAERGAVEVVLVPASADGEVQAVVELGFLKGVGPRSLDLLARSGDAIGIAARSAKLRLQVRELLEESQQQGEELQAQQEELRVSNEELTQQTDVLRAAQAEIEERKEELEASNTDLGAERDALQRTQSELAEKAEILARASQYKSEFLANMSHELRTPLNSTLILARLLADNKTQNLSAEQVKFAETIYSAGNDLLVLINDILDLSKIEAGKVELRLEPIALARLVAPVTRMFEPIARDKGVAFDVQIDDALAPLVTDSQHVEQILRNLLSNAFKFTDSGGVSLRITRVGGRVEMCVRDTGIGIPPHQHEMVFEAFHQADGTTQRKYGGTGLGLSISRELARRLGGDVRLEHSSAEGSAFTLSLPEKREPAEASPSRAEVVKPRPRGAAPLPAKTAARDDREHLAAHRKILLVVEDDVAFTEILATLARQLDFQCLIAHDATEGVRLARAHLPSAVILDVNLPDHSGLTVLDRLKQDAATRHIPVHVVSADDHSEKALSMGAAACLMKPVSHDELVKVLKRLHDGPAPARRVLVVEDDAVHRDAIRQLLEADDVDIVSVATVAQALEQLASTTFDCVVTDLSLPGPSGYDLLEQMSGDERYSRPPVIVYTGRALSVVDEQKLLRYSSSIIVKGARSPERLLDEVMLFLHKVEADLPPDRRRMLRQGRDRDQPFAGKKVLIAEDDVRNIFALTSLLEPQGAKLILARNGKEALAALDANPDVDLVLMDIMMPEMDGLEAMRQIRKRGGALARLPIIALSAKAMKDDQERCLLAGANDFLAKPLDVEVLMSLVRVWMPR